MKRAEKTIRFYSAAATALIVAGTTVLPVLHNARHRDDHSHGPFSRTAAPAVRHVPRQSVAQPRLRRDGLAHHHGHAFNRSPHERARFHRHGAATDVSNRLGVAHNHKNAGATHEHEPNQRDSESSRDPLHATGALLHFGAALGSEPALDVFAIAFPTSEPFVPSRFVSSGSFTGAHSRKTRGPPRPAA